MHNIDEATIEAFHDSLERCGPASGFLADFYQYFLGSSKSIAEKFADTNFRTQTRILKTSFYMAMLASDQSAEARDYLDRIAVLHGRDGLDIRPEYYEQWLESMIQAVSKYDPNYNREVEQIWRNFMRPAIDYMKSRY